MATEKMDIDQRFRYLRMQRERYAKASRKGKSALLDDMEALTGLHRKYLIARMNSPGPWRRPRSRERSRTYGPEVEKAVILVADTLDWICAKRVKPELVRMAVQLAKFGEMEVTPALLHQLDRMSVSTVHRMMKRVGRPKNRLPQARRGRPPDTLAQSMVPVAVIPWQQPEPGHFEIDLVHHSRAGVTGPFLCTLQCVDVLTGWSERIAVRGHDFDAVWQGLQVFDKLCPIPVREIHTDNGPEFMNHALVTHYGEILVGARLTRGLPGYKNHNRFVEQKNGSLVRAYLQALYLHTPEHRALLDALYADMRIYYNFFQPVLRQTARHAVVYPNGVCRVIRQHDEARTPLDRLLASTPAIPREQADVLRGIYEQTNPRELNRRIHDRLDHLYQVTARDERGTALGPE